MCYTKGLPGLRTFYILFILLVVCFFAARIYSHNSISSSLIAESKAYSDALNRTLGFHKIFVTYSSKYENNKLLDKESCRLNMQAIARFSDINIEFVQTITSGSAEQLQIQNKYKGSVESVAELLTHRKIYAEMEHQNIGSALILSCAVDVEMDLKPRLAAALGGGVAKEYDILFVGRTDSEPAEPMVDELKQALYQLNRTAHLSGDATQAKLERYWIKKEFLQRRTLSYRSTFPRGTHAYALSGRMARRMGRRLAQRMANEAHDLDFILADIAMVGLSIAYSIAPPPIAIYDPESNNNSKQFLRESVLSAISIRADQPSTYPPYDDVAEIWPY